MGWVNLRELCWVAWIVLRIPELHGLCELYNLSSVAWFALIWQIRFHFILAFLSKFPRRICRLLQLFPTHKFLGQTGKPLLYKYKLNTKFNSSFSAFWKYSSVKLFQKIYDFSPLDSKRPYQQKYDLVVELAPSFSLKFMYNMKEMCLELWNTHLCMKSHYGALEIGLRMSALRLG